MKLKQMMMVGGLLMSTLPALAEDGEAHSHDITVTPLDMQQATVQPNEALFEVHGIVCSFCAMGVQKKLSKLPFVDTSRYTKGVFVEIDKQKVTVALKSDVPMDVQAAYAQIRSGGYEPIRAKVADGEGRITTYDAEGR